MSEKGKFRLDAQDGGRIGREDQKVVKDAVKDGRTTKLEVTEDGGCEAKGRASCSC